MCISPPATILHPRESTPLHPSWFLPSSNARWYDEAQQDSFLLHLLENNTTVLSWIKTLDTCVLFCLLIVPFRNNSKLSTPTAPAPWFCPHRKPGDMTSLSMIRSCCICLQLSSLEQKHWALFPCNAFWLFYSSLMTPDRSNLVFKSPCTSNQLDGCVE